MRLSRRAHVYGGECPPGIKPGDFNVIMPSAGHVKQVGRRYLRTPTLDVIYYPATGMGDCYQTGGHTCPGFGKHHHPGGGPYPLHELRMVR